MPIMRSYLRSIANLRFLFNYLQLWRCYAILKRQHPVHTICAKCPPSAETHAGIFWHFPKQLGIFSPNFTRLLFVPIYNILFTYLQFWRSYAILSAITQRAFRPMVDILSIWWCHWWSRLIWHNFDKVADKWIKVNLQSSVDSNV